MGNKKYIWNFDLKIPIVWVTNNTLKGSIRNISWRGNVL
jgi:hypothetical protein